MNQTNYNPDVLSCLANLSNDEVFTPPSMVNQMLDMLPSDIWKDKDAKFLDPVTKTGVFLREVAKRLIEGLEDEIPDLQERLNHIYQNQVYGIAITELTSLLSRRSLYCSKKANGQYSICDAFLDEKGNIIYGKIEHEWQGSNCKYCGASKENYDRDSSLETHAYQFIHTLRPEEIFNMKFDVIIGNPPYQLEVGVTKDNYSIPIYHKFVQQAKKLKPRYLTMIIPSRWFAGGRGLDEFRNEMLNDKRLRIIEDFPEAIDVFPGTQIKGGVCYFLWNRDNEGLCQIATNLNGKRSKPMLRELLEDGNDIFIRYNEAISILHKVLGNTHEFMSDIVSPQTPFGFITSFKGFVQSEKNTIKLYISGGSNYVSMDSVKKSTDAIDKFKVFIAKAGSGSDSYPHTILGKPFIGEPGSICNQTYLYIGPFGSKSECENLISYINTKFFRFMVMLRKNTQDAMRGTYSYVPLVGLSKAWTDDELYKKYGLSDDEIQFIESMIRPME